MCVGLSDDINTKKLILNESINRVGFNTSRTNNPQNFVLIKFSIKSLLSLQCCNLHHIQVYQFALTAPF